MVHVQQCVRSTNHWVLKELGVSLLRIPESSQDHTGGGDTSSGFQPMILFVCVCVKRAKLTRVIQTSICCIGSTAAAACWVVKPTAGT